MRRTVTIGPLHFLFTNLNTSMGIAPHSHSATLDVTYTTLGRHGFPSFEATNRALLARVRELTDHPFQDATNEDVAERLFDHLDGYVAAEWERWGGDYQLQAIRLGVIGVFDDIGHDQGTTYLTVERDPAPAEVERLTADIARQVLAELPRQRRLQGRQVIR